MSDTKPLAPLHLAVPVNDLAQAAHFYGEMLGCERGRSSERWIDWNFFGHQFVTHLVDEMPSTPKHNEVDNKAVPVPHFGVVLTMENWSALAERVTRYLESVERSFVVAPYIRFEGQVGEQGTFFLYDPAGNALEFKGFANMDDLFAT